MLPKRAVVAIAGTAIALVLLLSFKTPSHVTLAGAGSAGVVAVGQPSAATVARGDPGAATQAPTQGTSNGTTTAAYPSSGSVSGPVVATPFGNVQVQVTFSGGRIAGIQALQLPADHPRSQEISQYAEPILQQEALQAQSAQIDIVSGATYTSEGYARSLQATLDQARA